MARRKLSEGDYMDIAVVALLRGLERVGRDRDVLNELTSREQGEVFQAEARGMDIISRHGVGISVVDEGDLAAVEVEEPATPDRRELDGPPPAAARAFPALHLPDETDPQIGTSATLPARPGRAPGCGRVR